MGINTEKQCPTCPNCGRPLTWIHAMLRTTGYEEERYSWNEENERFEYVDNGDNEIGDCERTNIECPNCRAHLDENDYNIDYA